MQQPSFLGAVREWTLVTTKNQKMILFLQLLLIVGLLLGVLGPEILKSIILRNDKSIIKILLGFCVIVYISEIVLRVIGFYKNTTIDFQWDTNILKAKKKIMTDFCIDGIAQIDELVEFMIEEGGLPVNKMKQYFDVNNEQYKKLGDNLERIGILKRGPNNARVLATNDIDYMLEVLTSAKDSDHIHYKDTTTSVKYLNKNFDREKDENLLAVA